MADFKSLISSEDLKWEYLAKLSKEKRAPLWLRYNDYADILMILFVPPEQETDVFYAEGDVGLLVNSEKREVVGFQIEAFQHAFMKNHEAVGRVWHLSETNIQLKDFVDFSLRFEQVKRDIAREVIRATEDTVDDPAVEELVAALA